MTMMTMTMKLVDPVVTRRAGLLSHDMHRTLCSSKTILMMMVVMTMMRMMRMIIRNMLSLFYESQQIHWLYFQIEEYCHATVYFQLVILTKSGLKKKDAWQQKIGEINGWNKCTQTNGPSQGGEIDDADPY